MWSSPCSTASSPSSRMASTVTLPLAALSRLKRAIKTNRYVWPVAQKLRARLFGRPVGA